MKKLLIFLAGFFLLAGVVKAATILVVPQGGTGQGSFSSGGLIYGGGTSALQATSSPTIGWLSATTTTATSTFSGGLKVLDNGQTHLISSSAGTMTTNSVGETAGTITYGSGSYTANSHTHQVRVYAYRNTPAGGRVYSTLYGADTDTDDGSAADYYITYYWDPAVGADGYRVLKSDTEYGYNFDYCLDITTNTYEDLAPTQYSNADCSITPTSFTLKNSPLLLEGVSSTTNSVLMKYPPYDGLNGGVLTTNGMGTLSFNTLGSDKTILYNQNGVITGSNNLVYNYTNNRFGFLTASPVGVFDVRMTDEGNAVLLLDSSGHSYLRGGNTSLDLHLGDLNTRNVLLNENGLGNVGVGATSTPGALLSVQGLTLAGNYNAYTTTATSTFAGGFVAGNNRAFVVNQAAIANALTIASNGNVGIAKAIPTVALDVTGAITSSGAITGSGTITGTRIDTTLANTQYRINGNSIVAGSSGVARFSEAATWTTAQIFTEGNIRLVIDSNGNAGIGTTTPGQKLSVAGDILGNNIIGSYFTATTTTATSTFQGALQATLGDIGFPYASLSSSQTQTAVSANVAYPITFNTNDIISNITHSTSVNNATTTINYSGVYEIIVSPIIETDTANKHVSLWLNVDNQDIANSATLIEPPISSQSVSTVPLQYYFTAGQQFQIRWASDDAGTMLEAVAAGSIITVSPASPSVIMTIKKISR